MKFKIENEIFKKTTPPWMYDEFVTVQRNYFFQSLLIRILEDISLNHKKIVFEDHLKKCARGFSNQII